MKSFPKSSRFSNKHGLQFTTREINILASDLLNDFSPKGLDFGLELTYILLWAVSNCKNKNTMYELSATIYRKVIKHKMYSGSRSTDDMSTEDLDENWPDESKTAFEERTLMFIDFDNLFGMTTTIEELADMDRRRRSEMVAKLKAKLGGDYGD